MLDGGVNSRSTVMSNTYLLSRGTVVYVNAAGLLPMFTIYTAGGGRPGTGESITTTFDVYVGAVTRLDMKGNEDV